MTTSIKIDLNLGKRFAKLEELYDGAKIDIERSILVSMQRNRDRLFANEGGFNGHEKWANLKCRDGMILQDTGTLRASLTPQGKSGLPGPGGIAFVNGDTFVVGTNVEYAAVQSYGVTYKTTFKQRMYLSKNKICGMKWPMTITIPSREFHELTDKDINDIENSLKGRITAILKKGADQIAEN